MYALAEGWCTDALEVLYDVAGRDQVRIYSPDHAAGQPQLRELATQAQAELFLSSGLDVERIADAMVHLAAALQDLLNRVADDETTLPEYRSAARLVLPAARNIWSHYGEDSDGW